MKKIFASLLVLAATINVFAVSNATLTLDSKGGEQCIMTIHQADDASSDDCMLMKFDYRQIAFYAIDNSKKYEIFSAKNLGTMAFGLMTNADTDYTLTATNVAGDLYIYDEVAKAYFTLTEGAVYNFTATANETNETRFHLAAAPVKGICHQNGRLELTEYVGKEVKVVAYDDETKVAVPATTITKAYEEIALTMAAGQYIVIVNEGKADEERLVIKK